MIDVPPDGGSAWPSRSPAEARIDEERLADLLEFARANETSLDAPLRGGDVQRRKAGHLREVLGPDADIDIVGPFKPAGRLNGMVVRHGYLVREFGDTRYADEIASATKSFLSAVTGIAFDRGVIRDLHGSVFADTGLALLGGPHNSRITWHHLSPVATSSTTTSG